MGLRLIKLTKEYKNELIEMIDEWRADQEENHTDCSPWAIFRNDCHDFDYYLAHLENKAATDCLVPDSVFFLLDDNRGRLLGAVNIRHYLNDALASLRTKLRIRPAQSFSGIGLSFKRDLQRVAA